MELVITSFAPEVQANQLAEEIRRILNKEGPIPAPYAHLLEEWMSRVYISPTFPAVKHRVADYV